jgi:hypothetical protein
MFAHLSPCQPADVPTAVITSEPVLRSTGSPPEFGLFFNGNEQYQPGDCYDPCYGRWYGVGKEVVRTCLGAITEQSRSSYGGGLKADCPIGMSYKICASEVQV